MSPPVGSRVKGVVSGITAYGAFVRLDSGENGMVHISKLSRSYVRSVDSVVAVGDEISATVISSSEGRLALSLVEEPPTLDFEAMLERFRLDSDKKLATISRRTKRHRR